MADLIRKMQEGHTVEDLDTVIDEVYEARGEYDSLDERLDDMSSGTPAPASSTPSMDGTGSAGTSNQYARADHVHPSDTSKQNALSSTQLDAVNSGIDSTKVAQIETNKDNISTDEAALVELVDGGAKNIAAIGAVPSRSDLDIQVTDGHVSISGTIANQFTWNVATFDNYACKTDMIVLGASTSTNITYACSYTDDTGTTRFAIIPNNSVLTIPARSTIHFLYFQQRTAGMSVSIEVDVMMCTEAAWKISQAYQPYRPSYQELYERIVALEQANQ